MKYKINDIYDDGVNLITSNTLLLNDSRLSNIMTYKNDLDIIIESDYGTRELFTALLIEDNNEIYTYNINKIYRSIYAVFLANMVKYNNILNTLAELENYNISADYSETRTYGQKDKIITKGEKTETKTYGNTTTTTNLGSSTDSTTNAERITTSAVNPSFSDNFADTQKATGNTATDSTTYGARNDTETIVKNDDTITHSGYTDSQREPETIDVIQGYKNKLDNIKNKYNVVSSMDFIKLVANDVVNQITYNFYL